MGCYHGPSARQRCVCFDRSSLPHSVTPRACTFPQLTLCVQCNSPAGPPWCPEFPSAQHGVLAPIPLDCSSRSLLMLRQLFLVPCHTSSPSVLPALFFLSLLPSLKLHTAAPTVVPLLAWADNKHRVSQAAVLLLSRKSSLLLGCRPKGPCIPCRLLGTLYTS